MKLCWATIRVKDMDASLHFYCELLKMRIDSRHGHDGLDIVMLGEKGESKVELLKTPNQPPVQAGDALSIGLEVDSLDEIYDVMKREGIAIASEPVSPDAHTRFFFVNDPDGILVQFVEKKPH